MSRLIHSQDCSGHRKGYSLTVRYNTSWGNPNESSLEELSEEDVIYLYELLTALRKKFLHGVLEDEKCVLVKFLNNYKPLPENTTLPTKDILMAWLGITDSSYAMNSINHIVMEYIDTDVNIYEVYLND